jgi:hypothetical protein
MSNKMENTNEKGKKEVRIMTPIHEIEVNAIRGSEERVSTKGANVPHKEVVANFSGISKLKPIREVSVDAKSVSKEEKRK